MSVSAQEVKKLRQMTGAGMMDCKEALKETSGDFETAVEFLRKKGLSKAAKKANRETSEGLVYSYIHPGSRVGVLLELNCETDFVARTDEFSSFARDISMQIAAASPLWLTSDQADPAVVDKERDIYRQQMIDQGKPANVIDKIIEGKINKYYEETSLLEQPFIKDTDKKVKDVLQEAIARLGENIRIARFTRYELGS